MMGIGKDASIAVVAKTSDFNCKKSIVASTSANRTIENVPL